MQLTFPVQADGLALTVLLGLSQAEMAALVGAAQPVPPPVCTTAVIDTGTNVTCVSGPLLQRLGLSSTGYGATQTAGGLLPVRLFQVSLGIPVFGNPPDSLLLAAQLTVMELPQAIPDVDVLIGLDLLLKGKLILDGPAQQFTLGF
jgi:hypothetical protein